jgi:hypothetical protein
MEKNMKYHKDDDGKPTRAGDWITFSYGIPSVNVKAEIIDRNGKLYALTPGHSPSECRLNRLRKYVGQWYRKDLKP